MINLFNRNKCEYETHYTEECADVRKKICQSLWKDDGYGGKVWTEDPSTCRWLEESECKRVPHPKEVNLKQVSPSNVLPDGLVGVTWARDGDNSWCRTEHVYKTTTNS